MKKINMFKVSGKRLTLFIIAISSCCMVTKAMSGDTGGTDETQMTGGTGGTEDQHRAEQMAREQQFLLDERQNAREQLLQVVHGASLGTDLVPLLVTIAGVSSPVVALAVLGVGAAAGAEGAMAYHGLSHDDVLQSVDVGCRIPIHEAIEEAEYKLNEPVVCNLNEQGLYANYVQPIQKCIEHIFSLIREYFTTPEIPAPSVALRSATTRTHDRLSFGPL